MVKILKNYVTHVNISLLIIRLEDVMVIKPWYVKNPFWYIKLTGSILVRQRQR
jgi:hypothetical protein